MLQHRWGIWAVEPSSSKALQRGSMDDKLWVIMVTMDHIQVTIDHIQVTMDHIQVTMDHIWVVHRQTIDYLLKHKLLPEFQAHMGVAIRPRLPCWRSFWHHRRDGQGSPCLAVYARPFGRVRHGRSLYPDWTFGNVVRSKGCIASLLLLLLLYKTIYIGP